MRQEAKDCEDRTAGEKASQRVRAEDCQRISKQKTT